MSKMKIVKLNENMDIINIADIKHKGCYIIEDVYYNYTDDEIFIDISSFTNPGEIIKINSEGTTTIIFKSKEYDIYSEYKEIKSKDGTDIPVYLFGNKDANLVIVTGYGGFGVSMTPSFNPFRVAMVEQSGCLYAVVCARGGGEKGQEWHDDGKLLKKQNTIDDFIAVGDNFKKQNKKVAIMGGSNGGMVALSASLQRPDIFDVTVANSPITDMINYHKFDNAKSWIPEFGCSEDSEIMKNYLLSYSPLHIIKEPYPNPIMITVGAGDPRVNSSHSYKFISKLNELTEEKEYLLRTHPGGHGVGSSMDKVVKEFHEVLTFILSNL